MSGRAGMGAAMRRLGLFVVPAEVAPPAELRELDRVLRRVAAAPEGVAWGTHPLPRPLLPVAAPGGAASAGGPSAPGAEIPGWLQRQRNAG